MIPPFSCSESVKTFENSFLQARQKKLYWGIAPSPSRTLVAENSRRALRQRHAEPRNADDRHGIVNDSIVRGAQLIEAYSAGLRGASKHGKKTHTFTGGCKPGPNELQFDDQIIVGIRGNEKRSALNSV